MSHYGTVDEANTYFATRLYTGPWDDADGTTKVKALTMATNLIDRLNFIGDKADDDQDLEFPRDDDTTVPTDIENATYELALKLLDEDPASHDPRLSNSRLGSASVSMDTSFLPEHVAAGIPSKEAWGYLKPYLKDARSIWLERIN